MRLSSGKINNLLGVPSNPEPGEFYLIEYSGITQLYFSNTSSELILLNEYATNVTVGDGEIVFGGTGNTLLSDPDFTFTSGALSVDSVLVQDEVYGVGWNASLEVPTKNAIYDKIESLSGVTDGDKGDITVSGTGTTWTIDNSAVTLAKMADVATATVFYRKTTGTGAPEVNTLATLKTDLGLTGTNSGDQTSIVGISGTMAQFDTAVSDGNIVYQSQALGTPLSGTLTNTTGLPISTGVSGLGANVATFLGTPSSANLLAALTTKTGTGNNVFSIAPSLSGAVLVSSGSVYLTGVSNTAATSLDGLVLEASNLADATHDYWSPALRMTGNSYRTTGGLSDYAEFKTEIQAVTHPTQFHNFANYVISAGATDSAPGASTFTPLLTLSSLGDLSIVGTITAPTFSGALKVNASTATALQNARTIGGVSFNGTANITVATATGGFTISGGNLALSTNSITMTGSLAATGARVTKGWFTDVESTNMYTVGGTSLSSTFQPIDSDLTTIAGLTATTDNFIVSVASAWASRTPAQVRTTLGLVIGTDVQAYDADLATWSGITPGTGVGTALAVNVGTAGAFVVNGGALGTPSSGTLTNCTFPTLNQNTSGSAATLTTTRTIWGQNFNGSANVSGTLALGASDLTLTGSIGSTGARSLKGWFTDLQVTNAIAGSITGNAATVTTNANLTGNVTSVGNATTIASGVVTNAMLAGSIDLTTKVTGNLPVTNGGTGRATSTTAYGLIAAGTTATGVHQTLAAGATTELLVGGGASALPVWTTATGSGSPVRATSPTFSTSMVLGTDIVGAGTRFVIANASADVYIVRGQDSTHNLQVNWRYNATAASAYGELVTFGYSNPIKLDASAFQIGSNNPMNVKIGGTANRGTTEGTNQFVIFNGTAPVGTLTNGVSAYSKTGEFAVKDSAGNEAVLSGTAWTAYTPTITPQTGSFTTASASGRWKQIGKTVFVTITITITTNGTAGGYIKATLPTTAVNSGLYQIMGGKEISVVGATTATTVFPNTADSYTVFYNNTSTCGSGNVVVISGTYETA